MLLRYANVLIGPDFSFEDVVPDLRARDTNGHGTHLAGIIVGRRRLPRPTATTTRTDERSLGIAPGRRWSPSRSVPADGAVDVTQVIAAIDWVIAANASGQYQHPGPQPGLRHQRRAGLPLDPLAYAVERAWNAGIVVVVAAGNDGLDAARLKNPAIDPFVIAVGAATYLIGQRDGPAGFSCGGDPGGVDLLAPGRSHRQPAQPRVLRRPGRSHPGRRQRRPWCAARAPAKRPRSSPARSPCSSRTGPTSPPTR